MRLPRRRPAPTSSATPDAGVVFPLVDGERSTQATGRNILAAATRQIDTAISEAARDETDWRSRYIDHFQQVTRLSAQQHSTQIASDGLSAVHAMMRHRRSGGEQSIAAAMAAPRPHLLHPWTLEGERSHERQPLIIPYQGTLLEGDALRRQLDAWEQPGAAEPSAVRALHAVLDNPGWLDLRDTTVVVLGAGAELGPYQALLEWGARIVAVDLPGVARWRSLLDAVRGTSGTVTVPLRGTTGTHPAEADVCLNAGADIVTEAPEVAAFLLELAEPFVVGDYVYAPGSTHVRSAVAIDALVAQLQRVRNDVGLAYLATPTDCYAVTSEIVEFSRRAAVAQHPLVTGVHAMSGGRFYQPNYPTVESTSDGLRFGIADALISQQGANYALAKRIQRWRAYLAESHGTFVSINVAPATSTRSVTRNRLLAAGYQGAHHFGLEVFEPTTSSRLMAALLVHDLRRSAGSTGGHVEYEHPFELLVDGAFHGGMWRSPFSPRSVLGLAVAAGLVPR